MVKKITKYNIIACFLNDYSKKFYLRELASLLDKPHQTIKPYVEELVKEQVLVKIQRKNLVEYNLNLQSRKIWDYLIIAEKERLIKKLDSEAAMKILFERLSDFLFNNTFIIFGSSVDKIKKGSDIDLLLIGKSNIDKVISEFEEIYNKKIHKIKVSSLNKINTTLTKEIYKKHLILNNTEQVINFFRRLHEKNKLV